MSAGPTAGIPVLGLLHTSPVHVATFDALAADEATGVRLRHLVRADLLDRARTEGPESVAADVAQALGELGADAVLCTCSTIGGVAEAVGAGRVIRVDRPMAAAAVAAAAAAAGGSVAVLAALESTLAPTLGLLAEESRITGLTCDVRTHLVAGAWDRFEVGDLAGYHALVARAADAATAGASVVVLAQASMAPAAELVRVGVPVLSSPRPGLRAAARLATLRRVGFPAEQ